MRHTCIRPLLMIGVALAAHGGEAAPPSGPGVRMDYGNAMAYSFSVPAPAAQAVTKGLSIRVGADAAVGYDLETMRLAAAWTGGLLDMSRTGVASVPQGKGAAPIAGRLAFATRPGPGWAKDGSFADPRQQPFGHLPYDWAKFLGHYRHGDEVVLSYLVGTCAVLESPGAVVHEGQTVFTRTLQFPARQAPLALAVCAIEGAGTLTYADTEASPRTAVLDGWLGEGAGLTAVSMLEDTAGVTLSAAEGAVVLRVPAGDSPLRLTLAVWSGSRKEPTTLINAVKAVRYGADLAAKCAGGPERWPAQTTSGTLGADDAAYTVDTVALPVDNPWKSWLRLTGHDFFSDGRVAVSTFGGDVWIASGLDAQLATVTWKRFAAGLYEPLGLKIVDDVVHVRCRDQITRLVDADMNGEADFYHSFNNDGTAFPAYNNFVYDLHTDRAGNFVYATGGHNQPVGMPWQASLLKVSKDGATLETWATGLRAPNGLGIGPDDQITASDNQGHWMPASRINLVAKGGFYGYVGDPGVYKKSPPPIPARFDPPLCYIPMAVDNSSGGQVWATSDRWGPLQGHLLHTSYGKSALLLVLHETIDGVAQGGVVRLPLSFASGIMRARFNAKDGQLWVSGLKGWQTNAGADGCLQRVRWTGRQLTMPDRLQVTATGLVIGFTCAMDPNSVAVENVAVEAWNYAWGPGYGSDEFSPSSPKRKGRDSLEVTAAKLGADGRTVTLAIPDIAPVMQMAIKYRLRAADGTAITQEIHNTINVVPR